MFLPIAKVVLRSLTARKLAHFEHALKNPAQAQAILLKKWQEQKIYEESVLNHEYTSGSSGSKKKIGYTQSLKASFSDMFQLWACDIIKNAPIKLKSGVMYMGLSPRIDDHGGLEDDSDYVSPLIKPIIRKFLAVDPSLQRTASGEEFYFNVAQQLLARRDLEIISIWSPTYFLSLMNFIQDRKNELAFKGSFQDHWPNLQMISAWSSGESQNSAVHLKALFPHIWFQPKGLMATEGPMTIPWIKAQGHVPLLNHTYFEFKHNDVEENLLLHQLKKGQEYEILPRFPNLKESYEIGDKVLCTGHFEQTPLLEFTGRKGDSSDLVGEKLTGSLLRGLLAKDFLNFVLIPNDKEYYYTLVAEDQAGPKLDENSVEMKLQSIHHYKLARQLGQLRPVKLIYMKGLMKEISSIQLKLGIREGDQKDLIIIKRPEIKAALYKCILSISSSV